MATFDNANAKRAAVREALNILPNIQAAYESLRIAREALIKFTANTDPDFVAATRALHTVAELQELNVMMTPVLSILTDWETNHKAAIGKGGT